jgi:hypothetical protein
MQTPGGGVGAPRHPDEAASLLGTRHPKFWRDQRVYCVPFSQKLHSFEFHRAQFSLASSTIMVFTRLSRFEPGDRAALAVRNGYQAEGFIDLDKIQCVRQYSDTHLMQADAVLEWWTQ